jgi:integrase
MGLGSVDDFGLAQARERAQRARQLIADGIDPIEHRSSHRKAAEKLRTAEFAQLKTFKDCAVEYHQANADEWKNAKHSAQWINTLRDYAFPVFGDVAIGEVSKTEIVKALQPIWKTKAETAGRVLQRVRTVLNYAAAKDYAKGQDAEFWEQTRMALGPNERARKVEHHSSCPPHLVGALAKAVREGPSSVSVKLGFEFTILTAARSGETRGALWSEIDRGARSWIIPGERMKAGKSHKVPLSKQAFALIEKAAALRESGELHSDLGLIFPNASGMPFSDMVFTQLLRRMGVSYTMHGFRASFRIWATEATEYPHEMLELALAHSVGDETVRAYMRTSMVEKRRQLMEDWAAYLRGSEAASLPVST